MIKMSFGSFILHFGILTWEFCQKRPGKAKAREQAQDRSEQVVPYLKLEKETLQTKTYLLLCRSSSRPHGKHGKLTLHPAYPCKTM